MPFNVPVRPVRRPPARPGPNPTGTERAAIGHFRRAVSRASDTGDTLTSTSRQLAGTVSIFGQSRLPTGVEALDRSLGGGLLPGSVVAYLAPPASQSELLLMELSAERNTLYLSGMRTEGAVRDAFERCPAPTGDPVIQYVPADAPLDNTRQMFMSVEGESTVIIDPSNLLEGQEPARYQNFLNELQNHMRNTGSVAVLHCLTGGEDPPLRSVTKHMADTVLDLAVEYQGADVVNRLAIPKFRGGEAPDETMKLELGERVRVDTSRDIA